MSSNGVAANGVAIVTGAAQGVYVLRARLLRWSVNNGRSGKAIALRLSRDGFSIVVNDVPSKAAEAEKVVAMIQETGRKAHAHLADVTNETQVKSLVSESVSKLGPLSVMVANAGISEVLPLLDMSVDDVQRMCNINIIGVFNCFQAACKQFISQGTGGKLITASSVAGHRTFANLTHYSATKFAVRGLVQGYAQEFAKYKITANGYCPGITNTPMLQKIDDEVIALRGGGERGDAIKEYQSMASLGRLGQAEDLAKLVSFLAGPDSDYITGQNIVVDGGIVLT